MMLCFVCWEVTLLVDVRRGKPSDIIHYVAEPQNAQTGGRRSQRARRTNHGCQDQGSSSGSSRWVRTGIWAPEPAALAAHFLYGPSANGEDRGGDGSN